MKEYINHLKSIGIENFRVFETATNFEFAPITILTGKNNSGKSSLIKLLSLLKNSFENDWKFDELNFRKGKHNLGTYHDAVNWNRKDEPIAIKIPIHFSCIKEECYIKFVYRPNKNLENCRLKSFQVNIKNGKELFSFETGLNYEDKTRNEEAIKDLRGWERKDLKIDFDLLKEIVSIKKKAKTKKSNPKKIEHVFLSDEENQKVLQESLIYQKKQNSSFHSFFACQDNAPIENEKDTESKCLFDAYSGNGLKSDRHEKEILELEKKFIQQNKNGISMSLESYETWQPEKTIDWMFDYDILRYPEKYSKKVSNDYSVKLSEYGLLILKTFFGEIFQNALKQISVAFQNLLYISSQRGNSDRLISNTNSHLDINSTIVEYHDKVSDWRNDSKEFIDKYLKEFDIGESLRIDRIEGAVSRVYLKKKEKEILLSDLGYGYSQLLPILLKIKIASLDFKTDHVTPTEYYKGKILIIEEPESNLHPDFQSKLADLFVEAAEKFNIQFIIETHSEYLIRKLQYLTAKKKIKPRDTAIYYFYNPENIPEGEEQIKKIEIQETGKLSETFGAGFFDESTRLLLSLIDDKILN